MARAASVHVCSACGHASPKWFGQCPGCGAWNTLVEEAVRPAGGRERGLGGAGLRVPAMAETDLDAVVATLERERPEVCVIDSVQTLHAAQLSGAAGSVGQVREVADRVARTAKARDVSVVLVGHVTKE